MPRDFSKSPGYPFKRVPISCWNFQQEIKARAWTQEGLNQELHKMTFELDSRMSMSMKMTLTGSKMASMDSRMTS
jgi:hypothetical protein